MPNLIQRTAVVLLLAAAVTFHAPIAHGADAPAKKGIQQPKKGQIATAPPAGSQLVKDKSLPKGLKWKTDKESKSVFAVAPGKGKEKDVWFIDPDTGWAYTVDEPGNVFVANPKSGQVYKRGALNSWVGDLLYIFSFWDTPSGKSGKGGKSAKGGKAGAAGKNRSFSMPKADRFVAIYEDPRVESYDAAEAYEEVWVYEEYFESTEFVETYDDYVEEFEEEVYEPAAYDDGGIEQDEGEEPLAEEDVQAGDEGEEIADEEMVDEEVVDEETVDEETVDESDGYAEESDESGGEEEAVYEEDTGDGYQE